MAGFFVHDGPYQNTKTPNAKCCSDPTVLCPECARKALGDAPARNCCTGAAFPVLERPVINYGDKAGEPAPAESVGLYGGAAPGDGLQLPRTLDAIVNMHNAEVAAARAKRQLHRTVVGFPPGSTRGAGDKPQALERLRIDYKTGQIVVA